MKKTLYLLLVLFLVVGLFAGCSSNTGGADEDSNSKDSGENGEETIKVGLNYELSGTVATYGQGLTEGIEMAFEEINAAGGVLGKQVELIKVDNKSDSAEAANVSTRLATRKCSCYLRCCHIRNTKGYHQQYKIRFQLSLLQQQLMMLL